MYSESIDYSSLLKTQGKIEFIESAYRTLLQRPVAAFDLLHHLKLLKAGMPREGLLYCICKSEEFNNRCPVPDFTHYKIAYLRFKLKEKFGFGNFPANGGTGKDSTENHINLSFRRPSVSASVLEHQALSLSRMEQLQQVIAASLPLEGSCMIIGNFAADLAPFGCAVNKSDTLFPASSRPACNSSLITSPNAVFELFTGGRLLEFARTVKDCLVFTMPSLPMASGCITAVWGPQWAAIETALFGACNRWFHGDDSRGVLEFYNNSSSYRRVKIRGRLFSLEENAEILLKIGTQCKRYIFTFPEISLEEELYLKPGYTEIPFIYIGHGVTPTSLRAQLLKFAIAGLSLEDLQESHTYANEQVYSIEASRHGFGYYPYLLTDNFVRTQLHRHGFFQVEAALVTNSYRSVPLETTRYYYRNDEINHQGFYTFSHGNAHTSCQEAGVIVYIARRKGTLHEQEFAFDHPHSEEGV